MVEGQLDDSESEDQSNTRHREGRVTTKGKALGNFGDVHPSLGVLTRVAATHSTVTFTCSLNVRLATLHRGEETLNK